MSSEELFEAVWGEKYLDNNNTVMAHIARLREKLNEPARKPRFVKTVWGLDTRLNSNNNYNKNNNKNKNNADNNNKKRRAIRSRVSRTLVWQYFLALIIYTVLYVVLGLAGIQLAIKYRGGLLRCTISV